MTSVFVFVRQPDGEERKARVRTCRRDEARCLVCRGPIRRGDQYADDYKGGTYCLDEVTRPRG
jgi:hypothetical protein